MVEIAWQTRVGTSELQVCSCRIVTVDQAWFGLVGALAVDVETQNIRGADLPCQPNCILTFQRQCANGRKLAQVTELVEIEICLIRVTGSRTVIHGINHVVPICVEAALVNFTIAIVVFSVAELQAGQVSQYELLFHVLVLIYYAIIRLHG